MDTNFISPSGSCESIVDWLSDIEGDSLMWFEVFMQILHAAYHTRLCIVLEARIINRHNDIIHDLQLGAEY